MPMNHGKAFGLLVYRPLRFCADLFFRLKYGFRHDRMRLPAGGTVVVANHTMDMDPFFCICCFPDQMGIVMSEHLMRKPFLSKAIRFLIDVIIRVKTRTESQTAFAMIKSLKAGKNVLIFPEGSMTYTGVSKDMVGGLGRLIKISGANLVTVRLENTFAYSPRWSESSGRGKGYARIVHTYSSEELKGKKPEAIEEIIRDDTYFDLYAQPLPAIRNRKRAEYLENFLYLCPSCGGLSTMHGHGTHFVCSCGLDLELDGNMRFHGKDGQDAPYDNLQEWYLWQTEETEKRADEWKKTENAITLDDGIAFNSYTVSPPASKLLMTGQVRLFADRIEICGEQDKRVIALEDITDVTTVQHRILSFSVKHEEFYEIVGTDTFSTVKYAYLMHVLAGVKMNV